MNRVPEDPADKVEPFAKTQGELKQLRRDSYRANVEQFQKTMDEKRRCYQSVDKPYVRSEFLLKEKPEITSIVQRKEQRRIQSRQG